MTYELLIQDRAGNKTWELSTLTEEISYITNRTGSPGTLKFNLVSSDSVSFSEGDPVRFSVDGTPIFYGFVFTRSVDRWGVMDVTCYDQLRYLKASASYAFYGMTAGAIIRQIAEDFQLNVGELADTGYALPSYIQENQTCLDIISGAVQQTLLNTGKLYVFYDNMGELTLSLAGSMISNVVLGYQSLVGDYRWKNDIDAQTYNQIKLVRPNQETGRADAYVVYDSDTIQQWGLLQYYSQVDENMNDAQIEEQAKTLLDYYNQPYQTFSASSLGVVGLRAGQMAPINIPAVGITKLVLLDKVTHTFRHDYHEMDIETIPLGS